LSVHDAAERAARRDLFRYVTADVADDYAAIMDLFTSNLLADLSALEVADGLERAGAHLSTEDVETRCEQLIAWGNLVRSVRDTRVKTITDYLRSRARYQPSKLGGMVYRQVTDLMAEVGGGEPSDVLEAGLGDLAAAAAPIIKTLTANPVWPLPAEDRMTVALCEARRQRPATETDPR